MYYAAYGSNLNFEQMAVRCPKSKFIKTGFVYGYKLYFNIHADIIYTGNPNDKVPVGIWDIHPDDWRMLDRYEGCPKYYTRDTIRVYDGKETIKCIVYLMNNKTFDVAFPDMYYLDIIAWGYEDCGLDKSYLQDALLYTAKQGACI